MTVLYVHQAGDGYVENSCPGSPQPLKILAHAWPLSPTTPEFEGPGVEVLVAGSRRSRPEAKHSSWLRDREHLDILKVKVRYFASEMAYHSLFQEVYCYKFGVVRDGQSNSEALCAYKASRVSGHLPPTLWFIE